MTITPHILAGAAVASLLPTGSTPMKLLGFGLGFASHYVLDAMPHWERLYGAHYNDELPKSYSSWPKHITGQAIGDALLGCLMFTVILFVAVPGPNRVCVC